MLEEIQSGNACYHSVQNLLSSTKNIKIEIYIYCLLFCVGVKHCCSH